MFICKKRILYFSILLNLGILIFFKYSNFFILNFNYLNNFFFTKSEIAKPLLVLLPPGISFYTFQSVAYILDVYKNKIKPEKSFLNYSLFLGFFPQLVAGPIVNSAQFLPQLRKIDFFQFGEINLKKSIYFIMLGFFKKSVIADNISVIVDLCYNKDFTSSMSSFSLFVGMISYSIQIYMDFSGYSDMAIGLALFFGINLPENFRFPYLAKSITEFWRSWHITRSNWLKDYLYIPLGGSKLSNFYTYRNLLITMLLGGLWHGANWNFILWGGLHGIFLSVDRIFQSYANFKYLEENPFFNIIRILFVFLLVSLIWVFFRAPNISIAIEYIQVMFQFKSGIELGYTKLNLFYSILALFILGNFFGKKFGSRIEKILEDELRLGILFIISVLLILFVLLSGELKPFIYFVF
jgi:alginate O-acetyltransferase complex protein AlgI